MFEQVAKHNFRWLDTPATISTVKIYGEYETMVMFEDGEEIESFTTYTLEDARKKHNETMRKWTVKSFEGTTADLLGVPNYGQFMHTIKAC